MLIVARLSALLLCSALAWAQQASNTAVITVAPNSNVPSGTLLLNSTASSVVNASSGSHSGSVASSTSSLPVASLPESLTTGTQAPGAPKASGSGQYGPGDNYIAAAQAIRAARTRWLLFGGVTYIIVSSGL